MKISLEWIFLDIYIFYFYSFSLLIGLVYRSQNKDRRIIEICKNFIIIFYLSILLHI